MDEHRDEFRDESTTADLGEQSVPRPECEPDGEAALPAQAANPRKWVNHTFFWLLVYNLVAVLFGMFMLRFDPGMMFIGAIVVGNLILFLVSRKKYRVNYLEKNKKMTWRAFLTMLGLMCICQLLQTVIMLGVDSTGLEGTSISINISSITMFLYAAFLGPIAEELAYRGFTLGALKRFGKIGALVISSLAFGLMHGNVGQFVIGTLTGLVLGYFAMEYSLKWSIVAHIFNNFVLALIPTLLFKDPAAQETAEIALISALAVVGLILAIADRGKLKEFFASEGAHAEKGYAAKVVTSIWFLVFVVLFATVAVLIIMVPEMQAVFETL